MLTVLLGYTDAKRACYDGVSGATDGTTEPWPILGEFFLKVEI